VKTKRICVIIEEAPSRKATLELAAGTTLKKKTSVEKGKPVISLN